VINLLDREVFYNEQLVIILAYKNIVDVEV
jgi:hypothetical protein